MKFEDLNLLPSLLKALRDQKYAEPTSIQEKAIPLILAREDVLGSAQTGTGKTAGFTLPLLQLLNEKPPVKSNRARALVLPYPAPGCAVAHRYVMMVRSCFVNARRNSPVRERLAQCVFFRPPSAALSVSFRPPTLYIIRQFY